LHLRPPSAKSFFPYHSLTALWTPGANISKKSFSEKRKFFFIRWKLTPLSLPKEVRTYLDASQPLLNFPSAVPLGGEGLLGGLPLICHHQKERTKPHTPRASDPAGCTGQASVGEGSG
jgi:hypothetical protein